jgi:hypothetical protein
MKGWLYKTTVVKGMGKAGPAAAQKKSVTAVWPKRMTGKKERVDCMKQPEYPLGAVAGIHIKSRQPTGSVAYPHSY